MAMIDLTLETLIIGANHMSDYIGIDYGRGETNIDKETDIRYGVISQNDVLQAWADSSEPDYGPVCCGKCGNEAEELDENDETTEDFDDDGWEYVCRTCERTFNADECCVDEPCSFTYDDDGYRCTQDGYGDIFIMKSPYYTRAQFCSPCAPGACYLTEPRENGEKAYCFGHDWFDDGKAPYPVYRVDDDSVVLPDGE